MSPEQRSTLQSKASQGWREWAHLWLELESSVELRLRNGLTLHMPLWREGYSELTAAEKKQTQEKDIYKVPFTSAEGQRLVTELNIRS